MQDGSREVLVRQSVIFLDIAQTNGLEGHDDPEDEVHGLLEADL